MRTVLLVLAVLTAALVSYTASERAYFRERDRKTIKFQKDRLIEAAQRERTFGDFMNSSEVVYASSFLVMQTNSSSAVFEAKKGKIDAFLAVVYGGNSPAVQVRSGAFTNFQTRGLIEAAQREPTFGDFMNSSEVAASAVPATRTNSYSAVFEAKAERNDTYLVVVYRNATK
jgi:hypothetical protein